MADEMTSDQPASPTPPAPTGQAAETSTPTPQPKPQAAPSETQVPSQEPMGSPSEPEETVAKKDFVALQSTLTRQAQQERARAQQLEQRLAYMQQQWEQAQTQNMTESERAQFEAQKFQQENVQLRAQFEQLRREKERELGLLNIARETGVDPKDLADVESPDEAWRRGVSKQQKELERLRKKVEGYERENSAPSVDMGSGAPRSGEPTLEERISSAQSSAEIARAVMRARYSGG